VESSCELGNEPSGSIKFCELSNGCTTCGLSSGTRLHRVSYNGVGTEFCLRLEVYLHIWLCRMGSNK
jgi:hypothetical protein